MANEKVRLSNNFIPEVIKSMLTNKKILLICKDHLQYQYLHTEAQKKVVKYIFEMTDLNPDSTPPLGVIEQQYSKDEEVRTLLVQIKKADILGKETYIIEALETFLRNAMFMKSYHEVGDLFQAGKHQKAIEMYASEAHKIVNFNFRPNYYQEVFRDYDKRQAERKIENGDKALLREKLSTGMHEVDVLLRGGYSKGTAFCVLARSGVGKSTYLRWAALANARLGKKVVYIQIEETEDECFVKFDSGWTGVSMSDMEFGDVPDEWKEKVGKARKTIMANGGRIYVISNEEFDSLTMEQARERIVDLMKVEGLDSVDMILFDYLEIMSTRGGGYNKSESGERRRREEIAKKMVNLAKEFKCVVGTATQSADVKPQDVENPDFKLTRSNISEFKNAVNAFSYFFTFNSTSEEYQKEIIRVYIDKLRKYHGGQTIKIYQSRKNGRFYDAKKTKEFFWDENKAQAA